MDGEPFTNRTMLTLPTTLINVGMSATNLPGSKDISKKDDVMMMYDVFYSNTFLVLACWESSDLFLEISFLQRECSEGEV
jgi:hypothetical protein